MLPAISSTSETATWAAIRKSRIRRLCSLAVPALAFSAEERAAAELSRAGANPNRMPAVTWKMNVPYSAGNASAVTTTTASRKAQLKAVQTLTVATMCRAQHGWYMCCFVLGAAWFIPL
ncbi:MAG: hypothetical protein QOE55_584 [Acidobacteriaceae bacterium]|jgi:hypothetical protein|nr:hypothetical protein [Acidobacteriaceae bacterium]